MDKIQPEEYLRDELRVFVVPVDIFDVPGLTCHEQMVYIVLRSHCSAREMTAFPSYATIAREGRMSRDKAIQAMKKLIELGLVSKTEQYTVNKHKKIVQTANTYTIHTPKGSRSQRPGESSSTTRVVVHNDQGSRSQRLKQNHLTDPSEQDQLTTTETNDVVVAVEESLGKKVKLSDLKRWIQQYGKEYILAKAQYIATTRDKYRNVVGAFRKAIEENWDTEAFNEVAATAEIAQVRDERYSAFYKLFPDIG